MITALELLRDLIEDAVAVADCEVNRVVITAGQPAAPSGEGQECQTAIFVFGNDVTDLNQTVDNACIVKSRWAMQYQIFTCYPEAWEDVSDEAHETAAACLYELMSLVWCALVEAYDHGYFCDDCRLVELQPMEVQPRSGGAVSALGGVVIPYNCPLPVVEESPSSPSSP